MLYAAQISSLAGWSCCGGVLPNLLLLKLRMLLLLDMLLSLFSGIERGLELLLDALPSLLLLRELADLLARTGKKGLHLFFTILPVRFG